MKNLISTGAIFAALGVILGAFGAHALREKLSIQQLAIFETGVRYQFYHALAIIACGLLSERLNTSLVNYSAIFFAAGILLFSGSLYLLSTTAINGLEAYKKVLGPITPLGGLCFIIGWVLLIVSVKSK